MELREFDRNVSWQHREGAARSFRQMERRNARSCHRAFCFFNLADTEESLTLADATRGKVIRRAKRVPILRQPTG